MNRWRVKIFSGDFVLKYPLGPTTLSNAKRQATTYFKQGRRLVGDTMYLINLATEETYRRKVAKIKGGEIILDEWEVK